jgi:putative DNA methylase
MNRDTRDLVSGRGYGFFVWSDLFTPRQLVALTTLSDLVHEAGERAKRDALLAGLPSDGKALKDGGSTADAYADAIRIYLGLTVSKSADYNSTICGWIGGGETLRSTFGRQAIPMVWDYCEANIVGDASGSYFSVIDQMSRSLDVLPGLSGGRASQCDAQSVAIEMRVVSTDPPYYNNIGYADLSDFFYVWLRRMLKPLLPDLFATLATPKAEELVATQYRHGSKEKAEVFFLTGMTSAMHRLAEQANSAFPVTIYYAFKQSETESDEEGSAVSTTSTGWDTFLEAVLRAGFAITGTWPMRTERGSRSIGIGTNALASSIILVCSKRAPAAITVSRREFLRELNGVLPEALDEMTKGAGGEHSPVAPVDLSQAIIGPGMAVFSKYAAVLEADGSPMSVRTALQLINRFLAEDDFDADTQFCLHWFEQSGWGEGRFGEADTLSRAKGTSVDGMRDAGVVESGGGSVRLRKWSEYPADWNPQTDTRNPVWENLHHLIRVLKQKGETGAGRLLAAVMGKGEATRQLAYRLYTLCERQGWAEDARAYNELITSWTGIESAANSVPKPAELKQGKLFEN